MNNCKYCKADCALTGEENLEERKGHIPMNNADRFRAMSNEEQQNFVRKFWEIEDFADWLEQTAE